MTYVFDPKALHRIFVGMGSFYFIVYIYRTPYFIVLGPAHPRRNIVTQGVNFCCSKKNHYHILKFTLRRFRLFLSPGLIGTSRIVFLIIAA